jgi:hypothetical protein
MLPGLHRWPFVAFNLTRGFYFFTRRRRKIYRRNRRLIITVRPSSCSTAARLIIRFASARSRVSESNSIQQEGLNEVPIDDYYHPGHDRHSDRDLAER